MKKNAEQMGSVMMTNENPLEKGESQRGFQRADYEAMNKGLHQPYLFTTSFLK